MLLSKRLTRFVFTAILAVVFVCGGGVLSAGELQAGKTYHGFKLVTSEKVKELDAQVWVFEHLKTGARLMKVKNDDPNNTFIIGFRTVPSDDTGVPHIMEHAVLNGSKKYPVKSPFDILKRGSLHTFLNAMTSSDFTVYPVASMNKKDFFNLMDIYLDAVLFPRIYDEPRILKREGWHYALESKDAPLKINGIVYNEMKGSFSSPTRQLSYFVNKELYPDNTYGCSSGGYPEAIPGLTPKMFLNFHKTFYHPSNSYIFLQGDGDVHAELKHIDTHFLSKFKKSNVDTSIPLQKRFKKMKEVTREYAVSAKEKLDGKTWFRYALLTHKANEYDKALAMDLLADVLINSPAAPVRRAMVKAGVGKEVMCSSGTKLQGSFTVTIKGANEADKDKFKKVLFDTLKAQVKKGFDKKEIEGKLNRLEFDMRENSYPARGMPRGLLNGYMAIMGWMYNENPLSYFRYEKALKVLREGLKTNYYENLIDKYVINNSHAVLVTMKPKKGIQEARAKKLQEFLVKKKASLSPKEIEQLVADTKSLKKYQEEPDSPESLKTIPVLSLKDVDPKAAFYSLEEREVDGVKVLAYPTFTNDIIYIKVLFDASSVPSELMPYVGLLSQVLGMVNTENHSYGDLNKMINLHTGGISFQSQNFNKNSDHHQIQPKLEMSAKVLPAKLDKLIQLQAEIIQKSKLDDPARLKEILDRLGARLDMVMRRAGHILAINRLKSYFSPSGQLSEWDLGVTLFHTMGEALRDYKTKGPEIIANLKKVAGLVLNKHNAIVMVTCSEKHYDLVKKKLPLLFKALGKNKPAPVKFVFKPAPKREGILSSSRVQYVIKGFDFKSLGYKYTGKMRVLAQVMKRDYLQRKIRIVGGAYGRFASFSRDGIGYFGSYRDPQLTKTLDAFDGAADYLKTLEINDREMTRYILGTISGMDRPLKTYEEADYALSCYLRGITRKDLQKVRDEVLSTTLKDIRGYSKFVDDLMKKNCYCIYGNEKTLEKHKTLFDKLIKVH